MARTRTPVTVTLSPPGPPPPEDLCHTGASAARSRRGLRKANSQCRPEKKQDGKAAATLGPHNYLQPQRQISRCSLSAPLPTPLGLTARPKSLK